MGTRLVLLCLLGLEVSSNVVQQRYDTIVIGLGSAGTTAASTLSKNGRRVLALEAQDRIGGRVHTVPFGDGVVELGAEWIHGTKNSRVYEAAVKNNITIQSQEFDIKMYKSDGSLGDADMMNDLITYGLETMDNPSEKDEPLGEYITRRLMPYIEQKYPKLLNDEDFMDEFFDIVNKVVDRHEGSNDWNDVTANSNYTLLEGSQEMSWHRHGYKTFFELLLNTYNNGPGWPTLDIKLNKEVKLIKWPKDSSGDVEVTCADGSVYRADNVIVTVSLGVLKERYQTLFSPPLPDEKVTAIDKMSIGVIGKIIFSFSERWWPINPAYIFLWLKSDKEKYDKWQVGLKDISAIKGSDNTLKMWTIGETTKLIETLPEDVVKTKGMEVIRMFMGKNITIPEPTGVLRTTWYSNPFTKGSYTYDNVLTSQHPTARADLGAPLRDSTGALRVLFAGEATDLVHFSTVHGASDSGYREAMRLLSIKN